MIELVTLPSAFGLRNVSPFCLKTEMLLTHLGIPFSLSELGDPRKAPKGKLPYLVADGRKIPDSELIAEYLDGATQGRVFAGLSPAQKSAGFALTRLAEDHLYWLMVASRWLDDDWWPNVYQGFFGFVPRPVRRVAANAARRQIRMTLNLQGLGRHSLAEQQGFARRDLQALQDSVSAEGFLLGAAPNVFDFAVAGLLSGIYDNQPATWLTVLAQDYRGLHDYAERVQARVGIFGRASP